MENKKSKGVQLNKFQKKAVYLPNGINCVIAGAGAGKTKVLTQRIVHLVDDFGFKMKNILAITFTKKAAKEISDRVKTAFGTEVKLDLTAGGKIQTICTIHGFCGKLLKEEKQNGEKNATVLEENERDKFIENICAKNNFNYKHLDKVLFFEILRSIRLNGFVSKKIISDFSKHKKRNSADQKIKDTERIARLYINELKENNRCDYDESLTRVYKLLKEDKAVRLKWQNKYECILVDEFQDVDLIQYEIISMLSEVKKNLFVVGDSDQSIYSWRGAIPNIEEKFQHDFPKANILKLTQNYRCSKKILKVANTLIKHNCERTKKKLFTKIKHSAKVVYYHALSRAQEAKWVVDQIEQLINFEDEYIFNNIAIIYRNNSCADLVEQELVRRCLPYYKIKENSFYHRRDIASLFTYIKAIVLNDKKSIIKILKSGHYKIIQSVIESIESLSLKLNCPFYHALLSCDQNISLSENNRKNINAFIEKVKKIKSIPISKFSLFVDEIRNVFSEEIIGNENSENQVDNFELLCQAVDHFQKNNPDKTFKDFVQSVDPLLEKNDGVGTKESNSKKKDDEEVPDNTIKLMTIHSTKGLEFPCVFIIGFVDDIIPSSYSLNVFKDDMQRQKEALEEERRLLYVALTRAKKYLFLTSYKGFNERTKSEIHKSRYLKDIAHTGIMKLKYSRKKKINWKKFSKY